MALLESVPNVSEGRDAGLVAALGEAFGSGGAALVDVHRDRWYHRSVFTLLGGAAALVDGLVAGIALACDQIDLTRHRGAHPRVGAVDVVPLVALTPKDEPAADAAARVVASRVAEELGLPVFLYGRLSDGRRPAFYRRGGLDELRRRVAAGELRPAFGPARVDARTGTVLVGSRAPLVAFNVAVDASLDAAREVAAAVRESSGGLPGVQALGLQLDDGSVQVSTNIVDVRATAPHVLVERIAAEADVRGVPVGAGDLVGLLPAASVEAAAVAAGVDPVSVDGLPTVEALTAAARLLRLPRLEPDRVVEWQARRLASP
jgi:glutamate formiminotransferase / 5-formyltetrahydrofolate cyclo-ligase